LRRYSCLTIGGTPTLKARGGEIASFQYAVIANTTAKGKPLIGYVECWPLAH
jgi:hypothetical protein